MSRLSRRKFFAAAAGCAAASMGAGGGLSSFAAPPAGKAALIHSTDLFRPYADPDVHFDLACAFSLAHQGRLDLLAVMIDHPPADMERDPDVLAVAQMNRITGLAVPVLTGSLRRRDPARSLRPEGRDEAAGAEALLDILRRSPVPAAITVVGSCRDVALAGALAPDVFAGKCRGIYLNAGSGTPDRSKASRLEYNVSLDPAAYAAIFNLPCPVYWMPCFDVAPGDHEPFAGGPYGTYYRFHQKDVLPDLSVRVRNYFAFMFKQGAAERDRQNERDALQPNWLRYLEGPVEEALIARQGEKSREMWCTAAFLHISGLTAAFDGSLQPPAGPARPLYAFDPVRVRCSLSGVTEWSADPRSRDRFLFHIRDQDCYPAAMTSVLRTVLKALP